MKFKLREVALTPEDEEIEVWLEPSGSALLYLNVKRGDTTAIPISLSCWGTSITVHQVLDNRFKLAQVGFKMDDNSNGVAIL